MNRFKLHAVVRVFRKVLRAAITQVLRRVPYEYRYHLQNLISELISDRPQQSDTRVHLTVGAVQFNLWLWAGLGPAGYKTYVDMQITGDVYEAPMVRCLQCILDLESEPVFVDVGSYVGYFASYVSGYVTDSRPVYAVESNDEYCSCIRRATQDNGYHNLKVLNTVLSDHNESLVVYKESVADRDHLADLTGLAHHEDVRRRQMIRDGNRSVATTFDSLCAQEIIRPTILKIDVHGAEGKVLGGSTHVLENYVRYVLLEMHPEEMHTQFSPGYTRRSIVEILIDSGFRCYLISPFRTTERSPEMKRLLNTGKLACLTIDMQQFDTIFFDRNNTDLFVFAAKQDIDIMSLDCFAGGTE